MPKNIEKLLW